VASMLKALGTFWAGLGRLPFGAIIDIDAVLP
jgi:hypothetical protein